MTALGLTQASDETLRAYREFAACGQIAQTILTDLESQIPGDFCPDNQYVTAHNLGQLRILQILSVRLAESQTNRTLLPEHINHGQDQ